MKSGQAELNDFKGVRMVDCVGQFCQQNLFVSIIGYIYIRNISISNKLVYENVEKNLSNE
jgi:hypothetical protein